MKPVGNAVTLAVLLSLSSCGAPEQSALDDAAIVELTAIQLQSRLAAGELSAERVTRVFLARIAALDDTGPALGAIITVNPDALAIAAELDARFAERGVAGPLHGIPVVLKANIDTADGMPTSAGSVALAEHYASADADIAARLRAAGAVLIAKANLSEWANFRSLRSTSGWSSAGGQTRNPYVLDRNPCGSSSGSAVAVAARLTPLAIGTETDGSIVCPAGANGVVGIKPTIGAVSQRGIVPIAHSQDTAGPLARTVRDAALVLEAIDEREVSYELASADLAGVRIGVVRDYSGAGTNALVEDAFGRVLAQLRGAGAELVDPLTLDIDAAAATAELEVLFFEFKAGLNAYLANRSAAPRSLAELIVFNDAHADRVMPHFGQDLLIEAERRGELDEPAYAAAVAASTQHARTTLAAVFAARDLDALVAPANGPAWRTNWTAGDEFAVGSAALAAISGYPSVAVPAELAAELPLGVAFIGKPDAEAELLQIATVFERLRGEFPAPRFLASIDP